MYDEFPFWSAPFGIKLLDMINYRRGITALEVTRIQAKVEKNKLKEYRVHLNVTFVLEA